MAVHWWNNRIWLSASIIQLVTPFSIRVQELCYAPVTGTATRKSLFGGFKLLGKKLVKGEGFTYWQLDTSSIGTKMSLTSNYARKRTLRIPPSFQIFTRKSVHYLNRRQIVRIALNGHLWSLYYLNSHSKFSILCMQSMTHNHDVIN